MMTTTDDNGSYTYAIDPSKVELRAVRHMPAYGAIARHGSVTFSLFSQHAERVWIALFDDANASNPAAEFELTPAEHRFGDVWAAEIANIAPGAMYLYRVDGPKAPGNDFDPEEYVLDPYARAFTGAPSNGAVKCVVMELPERIGMRHRPHVSDENLVIYETHVRGFTQHDSAKATEAGTYLGFIEKIPYLTDLGVTAVELLPVHACGEGLLNRRNPRTGERLTNYWGYSPVSFFVPDPRYATGASPTDPIHEFRTLTHALHQAGIEVIVDVVFNHTSDTAPTAPMRSFSRIDNRNYYHVDQKGNYRDYTGCGNSVECSHPAVRRLIVDSLRYWVTYLGVDGFRFDLAATLMRDAFGVIDRRAALLDDIARDPVLRQARLIAEPWDLGEHGYQVGGFEDKRWREWNAPYRDDLRRYWRGDAHLAGAMARRLTGSHDIFENHGRGPSHSVNFITSHDGYTLRDLVSYEEKHNEENGEDNRDGSNHEMSWNCGAEGETDNDAVNELRLRMQKNYIATLFLSIGTPMLLGGDEFGRTQRGNNNPYCQDNEISWFNWSLADSNGELLRFTKELIRFRREHPVFGRRKYFSGDALSNGRADIEWFDSAGKTPNWHGAGAALGCWINPVVNDGHAVAMLMNPLRRARAFQLPQGDWRVRINTCASSPEDVVGLDAAPRPKDESLMVPSKSLIVLTETA